MTNISYFTHLECSRTGEQYDVNSLHNLSAAGAPLLARYDLEAVASSLQRDTLTSRPANMWRYREIMPLRPKDKIVTLGEGFTPLHHSNRLGNNIGLQRLFIKDESMNPTGSFKARGLSAAVTAANARGARSLAIPTAGNAGGALAAYAAAAGLEATVFMPVDTPMAFQIECRSCGANLELVEGLITFTYLILEPIFSSSGVILAVAVETTSLAVSTVFVCCASYSSALTVLKPKSLKSDIVSYAYISSFLILSIIFIYEPIISALRQHRYVCANHDIN